METPKAIRSGEFKLGNATIRCYVLDNGERVVDAEDIDKIFLGEAQFTDEEAVEFVRNLREL